MSIYEALVFVALMGVGGFAWHLYRKDTRSRPQATPEPPTQAGNLMFGRASKSRSGDSTRFDTKA